MTRKELMGRAYADGYSLIWSCQSSPTELMPWYLEQARQIGWDEKEADMLLRAQMRRGSFSRGEPTKEEEIEQVNTLFAFYREVCADMGLDTEQLLYDARIAADANRGQNECQF